MCIGMITIQLLAASILVCMLSYTYCRYSYCNKTIKLRGNTCIIYNSLQKGGLTPDIIFEHFMNATVGIQ